MSTKLPTKKNSNRGGGTSVEQGRAVSGRRSAPHQKKSGVVRGEGFCTESSEPALGCVTEFHGRDQDSEQSLMKAMAQQPVIFAIEANRHRGQEDSVRRRRDKVKWSVLANRPTWSLLALLTHRTRTDRTSAAGVRGFIRTAPRRARIDKWHA